MIVVAGCAPTSGSADGAALDPPGSGEAVDSAQVAGQITAMLRASAQAWNRDDLEGFLDDYSDDPTMTFVGETVLRGKAALRDRYRESYFSGAGEADDLEFDQLEVRPLGAGYAVAHGRYTLFQPGFEMQTVSAQGRFTLVLRREGGAWKIIHDHSS